MLRTIQMVATEGQELVYDTAKRPETSLHYGRRN